MMKHIGVYPGTFDPITKGHLDIIERGQKLFDTLIVAVAKNPAKEPLFTVAERVEMIEREVTGGSNIVVESFDGLLVNYVAKKSSTTILRGLRVMSDFEYEFQMALTNRKLAGEIETVFMMTRDDFAPVSSRFIKDIARLGGELKCFVTHNVEAGLRKKYALMEE